jgi:thymidylate synthase (FAD)
MLKNPQLIGYTLPTLRPFTRYDGDIGEIFSGTGTYAENLIEFAGRVCYFSTASMGNAPDFIAARIREGHTDILEHGWITLSVEIPEPSHVTDFYRRCKYLVADPDPDDAERWIISGNFRAWLAYFGHDKDVMGECAIVAPTIFSDESPTRYSGKVSYDSRQRQTGQSRVTLLAINATPVDSLPPERKDAHRSATFLVEGVSRTCSHQFVRHRLASFSQESQRYVDLAKGEWNAVVPPAIAENPKALAVMTALWSASEAAYAELRDLGIRKEDARFLLPNAAETRFVVTMPMDGWKHFLDLRDTKAAQWEIRNVAKMVRELLRDVGFAD